MSSLNKIIIHIGAHKTGTTHFQDTLNLMQEVLKEELDVHYINRDRFRVTLDKLIPWGIKKKLYALLPDRLKFQLIKKSLLKDIDASILLISEENILGSAVEQCSSSPYPDLKRRMDFIRVLSKYIDVEVYISIRSFDRVLPGAFVTGLRFFPDKAMQAKKDVETSLASNKYPTWHHLISRVRAVLPGVSVKVWTQEDYRHKSSNIIRYVLDKKDLDVPAMEAPQETVTPNEKGVELAIQQSQSSMHMSEWAKVCDKIYSANQSDDNHEKFNFLSKDDIKVLKKSYQDDLANISKSWPNSMMRF